MGWPRGGEVLPGGKHVEEIGERLEEDRLGVPANPPVGVAGGEVLARDEIGQRKAGVHHGTYKVYVNFIPVADITFLEKSLFKKVNFFKPESSRRESKETYLHCETLKSL